MLRVTVDRTRDLVPMERVHVVTLAEQVSLVRDSLPELPPENILVEPAKRGTGPALAFAAGRIARTAPNATLLILPADHLVDDVNAYSGALEAACQFARKAESLVAIGLRPIHASNAYGYLRLGRVVRTDPVAIFEVEEFVEKPDRGRAEEFVQSDRFLWNTGTFAWALSTFLQELELHSPQIFRAVEGLPEAGDFASPDFVALYEALPSISIDKALLEHAGRMHVVEGTHSRLDVGDLRSLGDLALPDERGNRGIGALIGCAANDNVAHSNGPLVVMLGVSDLTVIVTDDVVLVAAKDQGQAVGDVVEFLTRKGMDQYL
jgi:mannose-1-phosphate guanylyltransferase